MTNNKIYKRIINMLQTEDKQILHFIEDILVDSEHITVEELTAKYKRNISIYVEERNEIKMD
ncbi:hypothetical protein [Exiguobacterium sp. 17-1]|uniref:hypothetical protein n=1 Tax=Exiguobacterium sp. 17-1 TaxID=2931981 RepID=UPI001FFF7C76|nr:hypothetical protein [Exiguobacterium sp. 17-1]MCK2156414.1 hypothetical protein [Exiguobacterium sp. 17-1]